MNIEVKQYNAQLYDQLEIVEEALLRAQRENAVETVKYLIKKRRYILRKLHH